MKHHFFQQVEELSTFLKEKGKSRHLVGYRNCDEYPGMVLAILISIEPDDSAFYLDLEWSCFGLDFYGDTLQESYQYRFESLETLLVYLQGKYDISLTDISVQYQIDPTQFPNPITDNHRKSEFEAGWERFQKDFNAGKLLDDALGS